MRSLGLLLILVCGCSSGGGAVIPVDDSPIDVMVGGMEIQSMPMGERSPASMTDSGADAPFSRMTERTQLPVSIMNVSERDVTIERLDISSAGGRVRVEQMSHPMSRRIDPGQTLEVNVPVNVAIGGGSLAGYTAEARIRVRVILMSGGVIPMEFAVPVYERR